MIDSTGAILSIGDIVEALPNKQYTYTTNGWKGQIVEINGDKFVAKEINSFQQYKNLDPKYFKIVEKTPKKEDFELVLGGRYIPHNKTISGPLESSGVWQHAKKYPNHFYITQVKILVESTVLILNLLMETLVETFSHLQM